MTINNNSVEQINVALLDMDKKLKSTASKSVSASDFKNLEASVDNIKKTLNETKAGLESGKTYNINISGNAATATKAKEAEKANKLVNALTVNGETYDGSEAVDAGVQKIENGGTGATTAKEAFMNLANGLSEGTGPEDAEHIIFKNASGKDWGLYTLSQFWEYIKGKISSILGLTKDNYGGKASTAGTADKVANALTVNGKTYDGSSAVNAGVQTVANGGTGATTAKEAEYNIVVPTQNDTIDAESISDETRWTGTYVSPSKTTGRLYTKKFSVVWEYIKGKISSVLGLTKDNYGGKAATAGTADKATNDGNGNNIVNTYALKSNLQYTKSININKLNGSSNTWYYLIAKMPSSNNAGNIDSLFVNGSDFISRMFEGSIRTRGGNEVYNYGKNNLPIELYEQTDGTIYVYWLVSDAYNEVALNITATMSVTTYGGNLSPVTPTGSKMTLTEYDYKSYATLPIERGGTGQTTAKAAANAFINSLTIGTDTPVDADYYVCQSAGGGTTTTTYHRRPISKLWEYIKGKISSILGLTKDNYGGKASTAGTADSAKNMYSQTLDLSALDKTKFYPIFCISPNYFAEVAIHSPNLSGSAEYNQNRIHFDISTYGWSDEPFTLNIREYACFDNKEITIGCIGRGQQDGGWAIWLRGGITYYCYTRNCTLSLKTSDYNYGAETYTVGTNYYGGTNTNVKIEFTPQSTIIHGAYSSRPITAPAVKATIGFTGNLTGNVTGNVKGNVSGSSGSCTGISAKSSFLAEYPGAGSTRLTSLNIVPKDASEYGGMRKDVVTDSVTDGSHPGQDGHLLTMFWDNSGRYDSQLFVSNSTPLTLKARFKADTADYGAWTDIITSNNIGSQTVATATTARTAADAGYLCKLYQLAYTIQAYNVILLGKIPDPASTEAPATPSVSWDIDVDFYFVRPQGHKAAWCNVKAGYGYSNAWRKYGLIETFGVDASSNYTNPFYLVTLKYNNEYYIGVRHKCDIDGKYSARVKNVNINGNGNPSTADDSSLVNMLKVIKYQKTTDGTILNSEVKTSIADFPNTYAPAVERNGDLILKSGYARIGNSGVAGSKLTIHGATVSSNSYTDTNPKLEFKNNDGSQNISLTFTDYDAVQAPASLTLNGNQGNEYFIAPNIKATIGFTGNLTGTASKVANKLTINGQSFDGSSAVDISIYNAYDHIVHDDASLLEWANCTDGSMKKVLIKSGTYNMTKGVNLTSAGTGYVLAENGATINSKVPIAFNASSGKTVIHNLSVVCDGAANGDNSCAFSAITYNKILQVNWSESNKYIAKNKFIEDPSTGEETVVTTWQTNNKVLATSGYYLSVDKNTINSTYIIELLNLTFDGEGKLTSGTVNGTLYKLSGNFNFQDNVFYYLKNGNNFEGLKVNQGQCTFTTDPTTDNNFYIYQKGADDDNESLILYNCNATYNAGTETVNRSLFEHCTCYNCSYAFQTLPASSSISIKVFYQCNCYNCICKQTISNNTSKAISFYTESYFYKECHCSSCDAELTTSRNIKAANPTFACYYNCYDRCVGCLSKINVNSKALTVYSTLYGFLRCQYMSSCKETHTEGYSNIKGIVQCDFISSTSGINGGSNTHVGNSCSIH